MTSVRACGCRHVSVGPRARPRGGNVIDAHVRLKVPTAAETARLLSRNQRWGVYYRSLIGDVEGRLEFRQIRSDMLRADHVDPTDTDAVVTHIEQRLHAAGYDTARRAAEDDAIAASWDIRRRHSP